MSFLKANLVSKNKIDVFVFTEMSKPEHLYFKFFKDDVLQAPLNIVRQASNKEFYYFSLESNEDIQLGHTYTICMSDFPAICVDVSNAVNFPDFDDEYFYDGEDLGAIYTKKETKFAVWAPLASSVSLKIENSRKEFDIIPMKRGDKGVYRIDVLGNLLNRKYHYLVTNSGVTRESNDPYGKGISLNSEYSAVVDYDSLLKNDRFIPTNKINNYVDAIIYETNVRDFTEGLETNIKEKGKYLGFVEEGRKTFGGNPAGLDYLKYLGITHVQLNPILDFDNVKDDYVSKSYNWGYDPISLFALEGSYSSDPSNPSSRLNEFSTLVERLHKNNIRVVVDVVYNHVFEYATSSLEKVVPNYFFRRTKTGQIANASGCGNDFASERKMAQKIIIDSTKYLVKNFNIDGFRFDLMGLLDVDTINKVVEECKKIKNDLIIYGEGWNMGYELPFEKKACSDNHKLLPNVGFFNDTYRDVIKGPTSKEHIYEKGYINGDINYAFGMDYIFFSGVKNISYSPRFSDANQSIIYSECHDNNTLFDKLKLSNPDESDDTLLRRIRLANDILLLSYGVPFIHAGQEFGLSKDGLDNTYNVTKINNIDWTLVDERFEMISHFAAMIKTRKELMFTSLHTLYEIDNSFEIKHIENGLYFLKSKNETFSHPYKDLLIVINPLNKDLHIELDNEYRLIHSINNSQENNLKNVIIPNISMLIFVR